MTKKEKILEKFLKNPEWIKYNDLEKILEGIWFERVEAKGSHVKYKHRQLNSDIVFPIHNNECKSFYKRQTYKILKNNSFI